jgi:hypothetical protein
MIPTIAYIFTFIFFFNLIPAFSPPTWVILTYIEFFYHPNVLMLTLVGALAATAGRVTLALLAKKLIRNRFLRPATIKNIDTVKGKLQEHKHLTFSLFLFYALSPLPSNQLFLAYGLTDLSLKFIALPFFVGRLASYAFWAITAAQVSQQTIKNLSGRTLFIVYFFVIQILTLLTVYLFAKIDWNLLFTQHKIALMKK